MDVETPMLCCVASKGRLRGVKGHLGDAAGLDPATSRLRDGALTDAPPKWPSIPLKLSPCQMVGAASGSRGGAHGGGGAPRETGADDAGAAAVAAAADRWLD